jgi:threonine synthase
MSYATYLQCKECKSLFELEQRSVCENCFGPVEVIYDYEQIKDRLSKNNFLKRENSIWRYRELLPSNNQKKENFEFHAGSTPLRKCKSLGNYLGLEHLYIKDDTVNPTGSFKDRPVTVAVEKALEWQLPAIGCASTGNLASATAAAAAKANLPSYIFVPQSLDESKIDSTLIYGPTIVAIDGNYDDVNRLVNFVADSRGWGIVNVNLRSYYVEGSKTISYEIVEQLNWKQPDHVIIPLGSGALLDASFKAFNELIKVGLVDDDTPKISGTQPKLCSPIIDGLHSKTGEIVPVKDPKTIVKSLAIGDPASGYNAIQAIKSSKGWGDNPTDQEIIEGQKLLARLEGLFTEQTGGCVIASLKRKVENGEIDRDETVVAYITGHGYKTLDTLKPYLGGVISVRNNIHELEHQLEIGAVV